MNGRYQRQQRKLRVGFHAKKIGMNNEGMYFSDLFLFVVAENIWPFM
jgi:hypothetical protein